MPKTKRVAKKMRRRESEAQRNQRRELAELGIALRRQRQIRTLKTQVQRATVAADVALEQLADYLAARFGKRFVSLDYKANEDEREAV
jgi:hypothetical protein